MKLGDKGNKYQKITKEQRFKIIELITEQKMTIKGAALAVGLGASTARMILRKFQRTGTVFQPKENQKEKEIKETISEQRPERNVPQQKIVDNGNTTPFYYVFYSPSVSNQFYYPCFS